MNKGNTIQKKKYSHFPNRTENDRIEYNSDIKGEQREAWIVPRGDRFQTHSYAGRKALRRNVRVSLKRHGRGAPRELCTINVSQLYLCYRRVARYFIYTVVNSTNFIVHGVYIFHNHIRRRWLLTLAEDRRILGTKLTTATRERDGSPDPMYIYPPDY